jgi:hypothetical protein
MVAGWVQSPLVLLAAIATQLVLVILLSRLQSSRLQAQTV